MGFEDKWPSRMQGQGIFEVRWGSQPSQVGWVKVSALF